MVLCSWPFSRTSNKDDKLLQSFSSCCYIAVVGLSGCSEKEEPEPEEEFPGYVSMLVENSGWSTVAYDDQIFSGMSGASFTYVKGSFDYDMQNTYENF